MNKILASVMSVALMLAMNSCGLMEWAALSTPGTSNKTKGTVIGASSGARTGAAIGSMTEGWHNRNSNAIVGAAVGSVAGGVIGNVIGQSMDEKTQRRAEQQKPANAPMNNRIDSRDQVANFTSREVQVAGGDRENYLNRHGDIAVYFAQGNTSLSREACKKLDDLALKLRNDPTASTEIYGHTDNSGNDDSRRRISQERASVVKAYLLSNGVGNSQIYVQGCADRYPVADNSTAGGRARNRRVEIVLTRRNGM